MIKIKKDSPNYLELSNKNQTNIKIMIYSFEPS